MSTVERNKGKLIPVTEAMILADFPDADMDNLAWFTDDKYHRINDHLYRIEWAVKGERDCEYFADIERHEDGSIDFHTLHYNGGAHWTELISPQPAEPKQE